MNTIALTGGTGFIGQYLIPELLRDPDIRIRCLTRRDTLDGCRQDERLEYVTCGFTQEELTDALCGCDGVIHLGGSVPGSVKSEDEFFTQCIGMIQCAKGVFDASVKNKIRNVVFASSISVYNYDKEQPYTEDDRCDPFNMYAIAKLAIEKMALNYHKQFGLNVKALRISQVFGARKDVVRPFLRMLEENCLAGKSVTLFGTGETAQDYVYVRDVCKAIVLALQHGDDFGEFNIGAGRAISNTELALAFCEGFQNPAGVTYVKDGKEIMFHRALNIHKARSAWGYEPSYTLVEACREMYELYTQQGDR